jgi:small subunit ribosomal protein S5
VANKNYNNRADNDTVKEFEDRVVCVNRSAKVVKGGKNFGFSALVVVGDRKGRVGVGYGKANEVADAIRKGGDQARKRIITIPMRGTTLPHPVTAKFGSSLVMMRPAAEGTGIIAGGAMRAVLELGGVRNVLAKSLGSSNQVNVVRATLVGISMLRTKEQILQKRDVKAL